MPKPVRKLLLKVAVFAVLNAILAVAVLKIHEATLDVRAWETDSILLRMPEDTGHDLVFLGTSRAYLFSRFEEHHEATERILDRTVFNMALPQGGGVRPARFYLESYFEAGNTAGRVVYFLDPFVLYSTGANENHKFVYFEPFRFRFFAKLVRNGYSYRRIITYVRSKFGRDWLFQEPEPLVHHTAHTRAEWVNGERIAHRMTTLYDGPLDETVFDTYRAEFHRIVAECRARGVPLTVVVPPTLLGPEPGHASMMAMLVNGEIPGGDEVHDWVNAMPDYTQYYNLDHMNLGGVETFMGKLLRPALDAADARPALRPALPPRAPTP